MRILAILVAMISAWSAPCALASPREEIDDLAARIEFAFFAEDARALDDDLRALEQTQVSDSEAALKQYYQAYGEWRRAQTLAVSDKIAAGKAAEACTATLEKSLPEGPLRVEILAVLAGCYDQLNAVRSVSAPLYHAKATKVRSKALELGPNNPRVLLVDAMSALASAAEPLEKNVAHQKIERAAAAFAARAEHLGDGPDWGHAEALTLLGESQLSHGDALGARNSSEYALILAPDYRRAQALAARLKGSAAP